ncbi:sulfurtransferase [Kocuria tytonicola]|uniref:Sulfurtransferase n=1 Tax=Kocuria tytonicola TaxID=2055946 RepID=A0A3L9L6J1_9MICC|nr:sulfurtransferase [Kocuria tytonicola]RLY93764.1 sulfurtransferase [Kocuria tytonicola]
MDPFVTAQWLAEHRDEVVLADARMYLDGRSADAEYLRGHLPGAVFVDTETALAAPAAPEAGRHPLPSPEDFAAAMSAAGIGDSTTVVAYDDAGGVMAARLVWMLRATGHRAALLDGGLDAFPTEDLERHRAVLPAAEFTPVPWPREALADIDEATHGPLVVDARDRTRYAGQAPDPVDPRSGHIPGAVNVPCREHLREDRTLQPVQELRARFLAAGVTDATWMISYCGSGVTACHNLLVAEQAGLGTGRLFPGSWSQYSHTDRPVETSSSS